LLSRAVTMSVLLKDLTVCVGDGCANSFADEAGWEGYCPSCLALWDDHAEGEHDPPVDVCLLCRKGIRPADQHRSVPALTATAGP
jgi:hypothetical protein